MGGFSYWARTNDRRITQGRGRKADPRSRRLHISARLRCTYRFPVDLKTLNVTDLPDSWGLMSPARSPDGQYLVATTVAGDKLRLFNSGTQTWSELTTNSIGSFRWSADSKFVYFDNGFSAERAVYRVRLADQKVEEVASLKDFRRVVTPWTTWFGVTPDGSLLLMRDAGSQEVYALDLEVP